MNALKEIAYTMYYSRDADGNYVSKVLAADVMLY